VLISTNQPAQKSCNAPAALHQANGYGVWLKLTQHASPNWKLQKNPLVTYNPSSRMMIEKELADKCSNQARQKCGVLLPHILRLHPLTERVEKSGEIERTV
jgi:hypothetical protein